MSKENSTHIRLHKETKLLIKNIEKELSDIEGKKVSSPEVLRRIIRIQRLPEVLKKDSLIYKRRKITL